MTPAAVYLRVSKDDGSQTVDNQRPEVMQMAEGRGFVVDPSHVYVDEASGAKGREERPAFDALMTAAARGRFRAIFVWALDRFSRDDSFLGGLLMVGELDRYGVALLSHQETWVDTAGPFRSVFVHISMKLAASERRRLIERTKAGIARARAEGTHVGRPKALASDPLLDAAEDLRRRGLGWRSVAKLLSGSYANVPSFPTLARLVKARTKGGG